MARVKAGGCALHIKIYKDEVLAARVRSRYPAGRVALAVQDLRLNGFDPLAPPSHFCTCRGKKLVVVARLVDGVELEEAAQSPIGGVGEGRRWARILAAAAAALAFRGVVHGDLRPGNIILERRGGTILGPVIVDLEGAGTPESPPAFTMDLRVVDYELPTPPRGPWGLDTLGLYWAHLAIAAAVDRRLSEIYEAACCGPEYYRRLTRDPSAFRAMHSILGRLLLAYRQWAETGEPTLQTPVQVYLELEGGPA